MLRVAWAFGNIMNRPLMKQFRVRSDVRNLMQLAEDGIAGGCELGPTRYDRAWRRFSKLIHQKARTFFQKKDLGIAIHPRYTVARFKAYKMHGGKILTSPARWFVGIFTVDTTTNIPLAVWVTHFVSGAWNNKKKRNKAWRQLMWKIHEKRAAARIKEAYDRGWNSLIFGDMNRLEPPKFHPDQVVIAKAGIIQAIAVPAPGYKIVMLGSWRTGKTPKADDEEIRIYGDHPMIYGRVGFEKIQHNA